MSVREWKFEVEYRYHVKLGSMYHTWTAVGTHMALVFHTSAMNPSDPNRLREWHGGVESHFRQPPTYMAHQPPTHKVCDVLGGNCWHDGTSLWAEEHWIPMWQFNPNDHEGVFHELTIWASKKTDEHIRDIWGVE